MVSRFYAPSSAGLALVHVERGDGGAERNRYSAGWFHTGVWRHYGSAPPERTEGEWATTLFSTDRYAVLEALVWLSSLHESGLEPSDLAARVLERPSVRKRLEELGRSHDDWIREGAQLALEVISGQ